MSLWSVQLLCGEKTMRDMPSSKDVIQIIQSCKLRIHEHESHTYNSFNTSLAHCWASNCPVYKWTSKPLWGQLVIQLSKRKSVMLNLHLSLKVAFNYHPKSLPTPCTLSCRQVRGMLPEHNVLRNQIKTSKQPSRHFKQTFFTWRKNKKTHVLLIYIHPCTGSCFILWTPKTNKDKIIGEWNALSHHKDPFTEGNRDKRCWDGSINCCTLVRERIVSLRAPHAPPVHHWNTSNVDKMAN